MCTTVAYSEGVASEIVPNGMIGKADVTVSRCYGNEMMCEADDLERDDPERDDLRRDDLDLDDLVQTGLLRDCSAPIQPRPVTAAVVELELMTAATIAR